MSAQTNPLAPLEPTDADLRRESAIYRREEAERARAEAWRAGQAARDRKAAEEAAAQEAERAAREAARVAEAKVETARRAACVSGWVRRCGSNQGDVWVIRPDGSLVDAYCIDAPRSNHPNEGTKFVPLADGCLALAWRKPTYRSEHEFEVLARPERLTPEQRAAVLQIQQEIADEWDADSPLVGKGWGLVSTPEAPVAKQVTAPAPVSPAAPANSEALASLAALWGKRR